MVWYWLDQYVSGILLVMRGIGTASVFSSVSLVAVLLMHDLFRYKNVTKWRLTSERAVVSAKWSLNTGYVDFTSCASYSGFYTLYCLSIYRWSTSSISQYPHPQKKKESEQNCSKSRLNPLFNFPHNINYETFNCRKYLQKPISVL